MPIHSATIKKLVREHFPAESPISITDESRETFIKEISARIETLPNVKIDSPHYLRDTEKARFLLAFTIQDPSEGGAYWSSRNFRLMSNDRNELSLEGDYASALVSSTDELFAFIASCQQRFDRQHVLKKRREKVRDLKAQAIVASVKKMAKEEKFDFATETNTQKLKLYVRLSEADCMEIHVPFKRFRETLPQLRTAILSLREMHAKGIYFKPRATSKVRWRAKWISHESLE